MTGAAIGTEDCLYLDISVPGGVDPKNKKPVMFWIHGGGYVTGSKDIYPGAALAAKGDVIVVAINYRLGALGFLPDGKGKYWSAYKQSIKPNPPSFLACNSAAVDAGCMYELKKFYDIVMFRYRYRKLWIVGSTRGITVGEGEYSHIRR